MEFKPAAAPRQPSASKVAEVTREGAKITAFPPILTVRKENTKKVAED